MNTEEQIDKLKQLISDPNVPQGLKESAELKLKKLKKEIKPKKKPVDLSGLPHFKYMAENKIILTDLPMPIRKKINGLRMFMGKDSPKVQAKTIDISEAIVGLIKAHLTPPPPPKAELNYTPEQIEQKTSEYRARKQKRKESGYY